MPITLTKGSGSVVLKTRTSDNRSFATANYYRYSYTTRRTVESNHTLLGSEPLSRQTLSPSRITLQIIRSIRDPDLTVPCVNQLEPIDRTRTLLFILIKSQL